MTVILELPPETETELREAARDEGVDLSTYLRKAAEAVQLPQIHGHHRS